MNTSTSPTHDEPEHQPEGLSDDERDALELIAERSDRLGPIAERILQLDEELDEPSSSKEAITS